MLTREALLAMLNDDLRREYQHMLFYMHAANLLAGMERLFLAETLKAHAASEMGHVYQFAHKIRGSGLTPVSGLAAEKFPDLTTASAIIGYATDMERAVVGNYHERHRQATQLHEATGSDYDLVVFLEEQIEHSQHDLDELVQIQAIAAGK